MALTIPTILILVALLLSVVSFFDNRYPLLNVAVFLITLALLVR